MKEKVIHGLIIGLLVIGTPSLASANKITKSDCNKYIKNISKTFYTTSGGHRINKNAYNGLLSGCYEKIGTMDINTLKLREDFICNGLHDGSIAHESVNNLGK